MAAVFGIGVAVGHGIDALSRMLGRRPDQLRIRGLANQRVLDTLARTGTDTMLVNATRACRITPPSTSTVAATATIDHDCATR